MLTRIGFQETLQKPVSLGGCLWSGCGDTDIKQLKRLVKHFKLCTNYMINNSHTGTVVVVVVVVVGILIVIIGVVVVVVVVVVVNLAFLFTYASRDRHYLTTLRSKSWQDRIPDTEVLKRAGMQNWHNEDGQAMLPE